MEHKIITGGEFYLPFARSRIKALRAAGLVYASQQFKLGDASVKVRIEPGQDYIELSGGGDIAMDSGIIDVGLNWIDPANVKPSTLYESAPVQRYNAPFIPSDPATRWRTNKTVPAQQLSGRVREAGAGFKGKVPYDARPAVSFSPKNVIDAATGTSSPATDDAEFLGKVAAARRCPASVFTGRCRLYVQALYGRELNGDRHKESYISAGGGYVPSVMVTAYRRAGEPAQDPVQLTTSTGVFLDVTTGKHWMVSLGTSAATFIPLAPGEGTGKWQHLLKAGSLLSPENRQHIEAYILSTSRPDMGNTQTVPLGSEIALFSMGYGWHWNWSGKAADIVVNETYYQTSVVATALYGMKATHTRLAVGGSAGQWTVQVAVIQDKKIWTLNRAFHVVTIPDWATGEQMKVNPKATFLTDTGGPTTVYAFYNGDTLKTCTVSGATELSSVEVTVSPPDFGAGPLNHFQFDIGAWTSGDGFGKWEKRLDEWSYKVDMTAGDASAPNIRSARVRDFQRAAIPPKSGTLDPIGGSLLGAFSFLTPETNGTKYYPPGNGVFYFYQFMGLPSSWVIKSETGTHTDSDVCAIIIPMNDAEAVLLRHVRYQEETYTRITQAATVTNVNGVFWGFNRIFKYTNLQSSSGAVRQETIDEPVVAIRRPGWVIGGFGTPAEMGATTVILQVPSELTILEDRADLVCVAGKQAIVFGDLTAYIDQTTESAGNGLLMVSGVTDPLGTPTVYVQSPSQPADPVHFIAPTVVGWA